MLVDTHCHLNFDRFDNDRTAVVYEANRVGVNKIVNPGIDLESSRQAVLLSERYKSVYAAVGIHPNDISETLDPDLEKLILFKDKPKVVAIGEIGLDYYWDKTPRTVQINAFEKQLEIAARIGLPVIIHNRDATKDLLEIIIGWQEQLAKAGSSLAETPGVLHSFAYNLETAQVAVQANFMVGITGPVTYKKNQSLQEVVANLPLSSLLVETDAPFLPPHPFRGKRNDPAKVWYVAKKIAEIRGEPFDLVCEVTSQNAKKLFAW